MATRTAYRRALAYALNDLGVYTLTAVASGSGTTSSIADGTPNAAITRYDGRWVYLATGTYAGTQRRVKGGGFTPSTGQFDLELTWPVPTIGDQIEMTGLFPCASMISGEDTSYNLLVDRALSLLLEPDRITTAVTLSDSYPTTTWPWLTPERLVDVLEPHPIAGRSPVPCRWRNPRLVQDGPSPFLHLDSPFEAASGLLTLDALRPGNTLIDGVESTTGFVLDTQTALPSVEDVTDVGLMLVYEILMHRTVNRPSGDWPKKYADQRTQVEGLRYFDRTRYRPAAPPAAPQPAQEAA